MGFTTDEEFWGFENRDVLTRCGPRTLKDGMQIGMELIDSRLRRWVVRSVERTGPAGSWLARIFSIIFFATPQSRIDHELEPLPSVSLEELIERVAASIATHAIDYGEADEAETRQLIRKVRRLRTVPGIVSLVCPDTFEGY